MRREEKETIDRLNYTIGERNQDKGRNKIIHFNNNKIIIS